MAFPILFTGIMQKVKILKQKGELLMNKSGSEANLWFLYHEYISEVTNVIANTNNNYLIPNQVSGGILWIFHTF